jgi:hypothetical protein
MAHSPHQTTSNGAGERRITAVLAALGPKEDRALEALVTTEPRRVPDAVGWPGRGWRPPPGGF